jgi:hypothetical protein
MKNVLLAIFPSKPLLFALLIVLWLPGAVIASDECASSGEYSFVCGMVNPEDLVLIPGSKWLIASGMGSGGSLYLVNTELKTWSVLYPTGKAREQEGMEVYGACPGAPEPSNFVTHGLNLRPGKDGHLTLYVVGHGEREAIEVFDVDTAGQTPVLNWQGCIMTPDGMVANSVASTADGALLVTIPLFPDVPISAALTGQASGAVFKWSPGDSGLTQVKGTEMPYANGIEVSPDGKEFYVASSGMFNVTAFSNTNPAKVLRRTETFMFLPDNLHLSSNGELVTAGLNLADPACGNVAKLQEFDLEKFASCPRAFTAWAIDPQTMRGRALATSPAMQQFSNVTAAVLVGDELWIGTFGGDRVAYRSLLETQ